MQVGTAFESKNFFSRAIIASVFPGSSAVEQEAVNFKVLGSNPSRGAN